MDSRTSEPFDVGNENKENDMIKNSYTMDSPKVIRHPLQQLNPNVPSPQLQLSLTPYRYHKCRVIPEEAENQENINPLYMKHDDTEFQSGQKSQDLFTDTPTSDNSSPFAYPHILESYQSTSSSSPSYHSPIACTKLPQDIVNSINYSVSFSNFESPKTSFSTPVISTDSRVLSDGSYPTTKTESIVEKSHSKHRYVSSSGTYSRGGLSSSQGSSSLSSGSSLNHKHSVVTPSKLQFTPSPTNGSVFRTPSDTHGSNNSDKLQTPQHRCRYYHHVRNPFEVGVDCLQLPTVSPSLFQHVVSPSQETETDFRWSIDQMAALQPANIETSPYPQGDSFPDPDYEQQAQAAIDKFFSQPLVVPSPWTGSSKQINLFQVNCPLPKPLSCEATPTTRTVSCQTELTLPTVLPDALQEMLKPYCTFTQDQWWQGHNDLDEGNSLNNTTLRRKLHFGHDVLMNATPICSPHNLTASEESTSSSVGPLPLHDDDDVNIVIDNDDDESLMWSNDIVKLVSNDDSGPSLRRCQPPTPSSSGKQDLLPPIANHVELTGDLKTFNSPFAIKYSPLSPDVSPIDNHQKLSPFHQQTQASPNISPIYQYSEKLSVAFCPATIEKMSGNGVNAYSNEVMFMNSPGMSPVTYKPINRSTSLTQLDTINTSSVSPVIRNQSNCSGLPVTRNQSDCSTSPATRNQSSSYFSPTSRNQISINVSPSTKNPNISNASPASRNTYCNVSPSQTRISTSPNTRNPGSPSYEIIFEINTEKEQTKTSSHCQALSRLSQESKVFIIDSRIVANKTSINEATTNFYITPSEVTDKDDNCFHIKQNAEDEIYDKDMQKKEAEVDIHKPKPEDEKCIHQQCINSGCREERIPSSPKMEKRSSGNLGHFSSSPIRDGMQSPLAIDISCKKFTASPPLSPILCHSILTQNQSNQQKSQIQLSQERHNTVGNHDQSTILSIDMEGRSSSEEMMDEGMSAATLNPGSPCMQNKPFNAEYEFSAVCEMDIDSQQSLEVNVSNEGKSLESGYQTGSMQSTNFNITSFTSNSTIGSMNSFQRDRLPSIFGMDSTGAQMNIGKNEKKLRGHSVIVFKDRISDEH